MFWLFQGNGGNELAKNIRVVEEAIDEHVIVDLLDLFKGFAGFYKRDCWVFADVA